MAGGSRGGQQMRQWWGLTFHIFLIKTELWIVGVIGGAGAEEERNMQKISSQESSHT
jgi:hypothetical protein